MKNILIEIIWGKNKFNGVFALAVVGLILAGCCGNLGSDKDTPTTTNTSTTSNTGDSPFGKDNPFSKTTPKDTTGDKTNTGDTKDTNFTKADASKKQVPSDAEMQEIAKTTLLDFNDALQAADFTDFYFGLRNHRSHQIQPTNIS